MKGERSIYSIRAVVCSFLNCKDGAWAQRFDQRVCWNSSMPWGIGVLDPQESWKEIEIPVELQATIYMHRFRSLEPSSRWLRRSYASFLCLILCRIMVAYIAVTVIFHCSRSITPGRLTWIVKILKKAVDSAKCKCYQNYEELAHECLGSLPLDKCVLGWSKLKVHFWEWRMLRSQCSTAGTSVLAR